MKMPNNVTGILKKVKQHFPDKFVRIQKSWCRSLAHSHEYSYYDIFVADETKVYHMYTHISFSELKQKASDIIRGNV